jgi:hypothetical protein
MLNGVESESNAKHTSATAGRSGQVMVEYVVVFVCMLAVVTIFALCLYAVRQQSNRALDLVASEYP